MLYVIETRQSSQREDQTSPFLHANSENSDQPTCEYLLGAHSYLMVFSCSNKINAIMHMCGSRGGGQGVRTPPPPPLKNHKNTGFLSNTGPDPLKNHKLPSQHSMLGHHRHASETTLTGVSLAGP